MNAIKTQSEIWQERGYSAEQLAFARNLGMNLISGTHLVRGSYLVIADILKAVVEYDKFRDRQARSHQETINELTRTGILPGNPLQFTNSGLTPATSQHSEQK